MVVTFLSLLELAKEQLLEIVQEENSAPPDPRLPRREATAWPAPIYVKSLAASDTVAANDPLAMPDFDAVTGVTLQVEAGFEEEMAEAARLLFAYGLPVVERRVVTGALELERVGRHRVRHDHLGHAGDRAGVDV